MIATSQIVVANRIAFNENVKSLIVDSFRWMGNNEHHSVSLTSTPQQLGNHELWPMLFI